MTPLNESQGSGGSGHQCVDKVIYPFTYYTLGQTEVRSPSKTCQSPAGTLDGIYDMVTPSSSSVAKDKSYQVYLGYRCEI